VGEAIPYLDRSVKLSPHDPHLSSFHAIRALGHMALDELDVAECFARKATRIPNANRWPFLVLASLLGQADRNEEAGRAIDALLDRSPPGFSLPDARSEFFFCGDQALTRRYIDGLRRAGLPERAAIGRQSTKGFAAAGV
jgi:hypothetical protein